MKIQLAPAAILAATLIGSSVPAMAQPVITTVKPAAKPASPGTPAAQRAPAANSAKGLLRTEFLSTRTAEFTQMDTNRDNTVTELEMVTFRVKAAEAELAARNKAAFTALDTDKNGYLSQAEFAAQVRPTPLPNVKPLIVGLDQDRNGSVSAAEYRNGMATQFDKLDRNRDGVVDQAEVAVRGTPGGVAPSR